MPEKMPNIICEVKTYVDMRQYEVKEVKPIKYINCEDTPAVIESDFHGMKIIELPTGNPEQPMIPHMVKIHFPETVKTVEQAFEVFEEEAQKALEKEIAEAKKRHEENKKKQSEQKLVLPGSKGFQFVK